MFLNIKKSTLQYIYIYVLMSSMGMALPAFMGHDNFIFFTGILGAYILFTKPSLRVLQKHYLFFLGILFLFLSLVMFTSTLSLGTSLNIVSKLILVYCVYAIDPDNYIPRFVRMVFWFALISIVLYGITKIAGFNSFSFVYPYLFESYSEDNLYSYGGFIYRFIFLHMNRNSGPFGEPGQYQCILSVAIYYLLFYSSIFERKEQTKFFVVIIIALLTTFSTSGYIAILLILLCFILYSRNNVDRHVKFLFLGFLLISSFFFIFTDIGNDFIRMVIFDKIFDNGQLDLTQGTGGARTASILGVFDVIDKDYRVLWGVGYDKLQQMGLDGCAGLVYLLLAIGILPYIFLFGFCIIQICKYNLGFWEAFVRIALVVNMGLGQPNIINFALFTMMFYPYFRAKTIKK